MSRNEESNCSKRHEFLHRLAGFGELFSLETYRAALAEAIGTFMLLFLGLSRLYLRGVALERSAITLNALVPVLNSRLGDRHSSSTSGRRSARCPSCSASVSRSSSSRGASVTSLAGTPDRALVGSRNQVKQIVSDAFHPFIDCTGTSIRQKRSHVWRVASARWHVRRSTLRLRWWRPVASALLARLEPIGNGSLVTIGAFGCNKPLSNALYQVNDGQAIIIEAVLTGILVFVVFATVIGKPCNTSSISGDITIVTVVTCMFAGVLLRHLPVWIELYSYTEWICIQSLSTNPFVLNRIEYFN